MDTLHESKFHYGFEDEGVNASSRGWFIPCDYPGESVSLPASFFQNRGFNWLQNQRELQAILGTSVVKTRALSTIHKIAITNNLTSATRVLQNLRLAFKSCPADNNHGWFRYSIYTTSKLMRFLGKVMTRSAVHKNFAIGDLYNSVYFNEDTKEFVLMYGDDIRFTDERFDAMVKDVTSFMVLFANHSADENGKPEGTETFDRDVVESYKSYRNFLQSGDCKSYNAQAAYNFPLFWHLDDKVEGFARGSCEEFDNSKEAYELRVAKHIDSNWAIRSFGKSRPATAGTNYSVLKTMYTKGTGRANPSDYCSASSMTKFFRNCVAHPLDTDRDVHKERMVWAFEEVLQFWWKLFMGNLVYVKYGLKSNDARKNFLKNLRFRV